MLEQKLLEELNRYNEINKYAKKMIMEQDAPPVDPTIDPAAGAPPTDPTGAGAPPVDPTGAGAPPADAAGAPPAGPDAGAGASAPPAEDTTEELDITDLVNMTKNIKQTVDNNKEEHGAVIQKMDTVFSKLSELEGKLGEMDKVLSKIDELGSKIQEIKPQTPQEKLEMRSLDSYPFSQHPQDFFNQKKEQMRATGKNEYVLTKDDVNAYSRDQVLNSFNPNENNETKF